MARLKKAAKTVVRAKDHGTGTGTRTAVSSHSSAEAGAMSKPVPSAAAFGASLLNHARSGQSHPNPAGVTAKPDHGKLKRPSFIAEASQREPANRGDVYAIQHSPEKQALHVQDKADHDQKAQPYHSSPADAQFEATAKIPPSSSPAIVATGQSRVIRQSTKQGKMQLQPTTKPRATNNSVAAVERSPKIKVHDTCESRAVNAYPVRRSEPQVRIPLRKRRVPETIETDAVAPTHSAETGDQSQDEGYGTTQLKARSDSTRKRKVNFASEVSTNDLISSAPNPVETLSAEESKKPTSKGKVQHYAPGTTVTIENVFAFLDRERRSGACRIGYGNTIKRIYDDYYTALMQDESTLDTVREATDAIRQVIEEMRSEVQQDARFAINVDAYAHLFRELVLHLKITYEWLCAREIIITDSLDAMRIVTPFMLDMLSLIDAMVQWSVSVPRRSHRGRAIKEVDSHLAAPLHTVCEAHITRLKQLEAVEERYQEIRNIHRQQRELAEERQREEAEERQRELDALARKQKRHRRWQDLHIARMQCEPDPFRRRQLAITPLEDLEERDANGVKFDRLRVFKQRSSPSFHQAAIHSSQRLWTDDQAIALLETVQRHAGPTLYEKIFQSQCRPGGMLRDFTVADIVAKVSWIRSSWRKLHQEKGWEAPEWVAVLPGSP